MKTRTTKNRRITAGRIAALLCAMFSVAAADAVAAAVKIELERSDDLQNWETVPITPNLLGEEGEIRQPADGIAGFYRLRITSVEDAPVPDGFAVIPAGTYSMGDHKNEPEPWFDNERPVHEVYVSEFYIAKTQVTFEEWTEVYDWAIGNGYLFENAGLRGSNEDQGELPDTPENNRHPVVFIRWYDMLKWCNAKSEREGLTPAYYTDDEKTSVYRTGEHDLSSSQVRWDANGYRLPTEAEWEKAARGGLHGKRWAWGDEPIDPTRANYWDSSAINGTTPVGSYPPNRYGIHDLAGNVQDRCWDWYSTSWYEKDGATEPDTRGPAVGSVGTAHSHVSRGGQWNHFTSGCRVSYRRAGGSDGAGFRLARTPE